MRGSNTESQEEAGMVRFDPELLAYYEDGVCPVCGFEMDEVDGEMRCPFDPALYEDDEEE